MTRVLALVTDAYGGRGGIAQAARDVIGALAAQDIISSIEVLPRQAPELPGATSQKIHLAKPSPSRFSYAIRALVATLRGRPDVIFCNHLYMAPLAALASRLAGAKLVVQLHGIEIWPEPSSAQRRALEAASLLLCVSRDTRARVIANCDLTPERAVVLNNTVDPRFTPTDRAAARGKFGLSDEFVLLIVGRLNSRERYKGHDQLISSLKGLAHPHGRSIMLMIAGDGDDRVRLEKMAGQAGSASKVRFLGQVPGDDLPDLYRAADLFAMPSKREGFGITFLEAMACGTPALGLAAGGAPDALGDGELGVIVSTDDDLTLALQSGIAACFPKPAQLADDVRKRFGAAVFQKRVSSMLALVE